MNLRKLLLILTLAFCETTSAGIVTVIDAVETVTSNISVPTSTSGRLMFRPCDAACDEKFIAVRLTAETTFFVRNQQVDFLGFRKDFFNMRGSNDDYALISYDTDKKTAVSIRIGF